MSKWRRYIGPLAVLVAVALAMPAVAGAAETPRSPDIVVKASPTLSRTLAEIARIQKARAQRLETKDDIPTREGSPRNTEMPDWILNSTPTPGQVDGALQSEMLAPVALPPPSASFPGQDSDDNAAVMGFRLMPPDTTFDVGPNHVVQALNVVVEVYDKAGTSLLGPIDARDLWAGSGGDCEFGDFTDPIVVYDHIADRWVVLYLSFNNHICMAMSQSPDPTGAYFAYDFPFDGFGSGWFQDYPKLGLWPDGYYYTANGFAGSFAGVTAGAFDRTAMIGGGAVTFVGWDLPATDPTYYYYSLLPVDLDGPTAPPAGAPGIFSGMFDDSFGLAPPYTGDGYQLYVASMDFATPANSTFGFLDFIDAPTFDSNLCGYSRNCIPQLGTTQTVDALSNRQMYRLHYRNMGGHEALYGSHSVDAGADRAGVRWFELRRSGGDWSTFQAGTYAPADGLHRWMGDVAMDGDGNMMIGYSTSSTAIYPSARIAGRLAGDPLGTMAQGELELVAGTGYQSGGNRWGDYSTSTVDPVDDCTLWTTQEYVATAGSFQWSTWIGAIKFPTCGGPSGTIEGTVTSSATLDPIEGAVVNFGGFLQTVTNASGFYSMVLPVDDYDITVTKFGFAPGTATGVSVTEGGTTVQDFALDPVGTAQFDGYVTDAGHGWPLYARVDLSVANGSAPIATVFTNPFNGYYETPELPQGTEYVLEVEVMYPGYDPMSDSAVLPPAGMAKNFTFMPAAACTAWGYELAGGLIENFEGAFPPAGWATLDNAGDGMNWNTNVYFGKPNNTTNGGGSGISAAADSDAECFNGAWDAELWSTSVDLPASPTKSISFATNFQDFAGDGEAWFDISTNGGSSWTNLWYGTVDDPGGIGGGGLNRAFDLAAYAGETVVFRWIYDDGGDTCAWWWQIDAVFLPGACVPIPGALVGGFVTDANTGMAINGAEIVSSTGPMSMSMPTPTDPNLPDGWFVQFEGLPGLGPSTRTFTAGADKYASQEVEINLVPDAVNQINFNLEAGWLEVAPTMIDARLYGGETENDPFDIINHGGIDANVLLMAMPIALTWDHASWVKDPGNLPGSTEPTSIGRAPEASGPIDQTQPSKLALAGAPAFGIDLIGNTLVEWPDVTVPGAWNIVSGGMTENFYAGDILLGDFSKLYALDNAAMNLVTVDTATGAKTVIGPAAPNGGESWTGVTAAVNGTLYASATTCSASTLYTVDPGSGAVAPIGAISNGPCIIDIAINAVGELYGVDIVNDVLVQIDPGSGAGTVIGSVGVNANFAQGMDFDEVSGTLYWASYSASAELRVIDTVTGASTLVGAFPSGEVDCFAIATSVGVSLPWLVLTPDAGVVPANEGVLPIDAEFIADGAPHYGLRKAKIGVAQDTPYPVDDVQAYFTKAFWDVPYGHFADAYIHALAGIRVTFGCGFGYFCPDEELLRKHMAVFVVRMMYGADYRPPTAVGVFVDVPIEDYSTLADYIEQLYFDGVAAGCMVDGDDMYFCPDDLMSRAQMAVLICKARGWDPVDPPTGIFADVPPTHWAAGYVERIFLEGVTAGCGGGLFCEANPVTRAQIAVFMVKAWGVEYFLH